ncbi:hypothetical protein GCM10023143_01050 [Compostibacter hankyongensis]|uniref:Uncharacterized protein n=1 Tax=Compostibacter hankyongensis TaxID=1007089 RepID=A0ABP8FC79_9BACT
MSAITIRRRLTSDVLKLGRQAKALLGKKVEIVIRELTPAVKEKKWRHLGSVDLGGKADLINIRNFAYDE